jgi:hypothetical protein
MGDEAAYLLAEMVGLARRAPVRAINFEMAWGAAAHGADTEVRRDPIPPMMYV